MVLLDEVLPEIVVARKLMRPESATFPVAYPKSVSMVFASDMPIQIGVCSEPSVGMALVASFVRTFAWLAMLVLVLPGEYCQRQHQGNEWT